MSVRSRDGEPPAPVIARRLEKRNRDRDGEQRGEELPPLSRAPLAGSAVPEEDQRRDRARQDGESGRPCPAQPLERDGEDDTAHGDEGRSREARRLLGPAPRLRAAHQQVESEAENGAETEQQPGPRRPSRVFECLRLSGHARPLSCRLPTTWLQCLHPFLPCACALAMDFRRNGCSLGVSCGWSQASPSW